MNIDFTKTADVQDTGPELLVDELRIKLDHKRSFCRFFVYFTPIQKGIALPQELRFRDFDATTPFIDMLQEIPNIYQQPWKAKNPRALTMQ